MPRMIVLSLGLAGSLWLWSCAPLPPPVPTPAPPQVGGAATPPGGGPAPGTAGAEAPPAPQRLDVEPSIEVGLVWDADSLSVGAARRALTWRVGRGHDRAAGRVAAARVSIEGGRAVVRASDAARSTPFASLSHAETLWVGEPEDGVILAEPQILWHRGTWRGQAKVFLNANGRLTLALRLPLESYLLGVVPGEIGPLSDALIEAGRAQAIAARSYTLYYRGRRGSEGFDLYGTVEDQMYGAVESERPLATRCVETTRGKVALYDGAPIRANYYSTCGGITADVWEGFPASGFPYLVSHRDGDAHGDYCARSSQYRWREEWAVADFLATVVRYAPPEGISVPAAGLGELVDARVESRSRSARVWSLEIVTTAADLHIPAYAIRRVLRRPGGSAILRSNLFKLDVRRDPATRRAQSVVVSGAGSGHGVGLCQTGALGMAAARKTGEQILDHYYSGITLRRLY